MGPHHRQDGKLKHTSSLDQLWTDLQEAWAVMPITTSNDTILSKPDGIQAVLW